MFPDLSKVAAAGLLQLRLTLCDSVDCSPPGSSVHGILQARILEWVAFPSTGDLPNPEIKSGSPALRVNCLQSEQSGEPSFYLNYLIKGPSVKHSHFGS